MRARVVIEKEAERLARPHTHTHTHTCAHMRGTRRKYFVTVVIFLTGVNRDESTQAGGYESRDFTGRH